MTTPDTRSPYSPLEVQAGDRIELEHAKGNPSELEDGHRGDVEEVRETTLRGPGNQTCDIIKVAVDWDGTDYSYTLFEGEDRWTVLDR